VETDVSELRQTYIDGLMWNGELNQFWYAFQKSNQDLSKELSSGNHRLGRYDLKSVIVINGIIEEFTDEELEKLYHFSVEKTKENDEKYHDRVGTRRKIITKTIQADRPFIYPWLAKYEGSEAIYSAQTVEEAIEHFKRR
jgi:hypothetical protein